MIYNLYKYIENIMPSEKIYANAEDIVYPDTVNADSIIMIREFGGSIGTWYQYKEKQVNVVIRDTDIVKAKEKAETIFDSLHGKFGLVLPAVTVNGKLYQEVKTSQINATGLPQANGYDEQNRAVFNFVLNIIYL